MKIELKPGVSTVFFWGTVGIGAASTVASALALTSYAWAGGAVTLIALLIGFARGKLTPPPGAAQLMLAMLTVLSLSSCALSPAAIAAIEQVAVPLAAIGLKAAVEHGTLQAGDSVTIQSGIAIVTNPNDTTLTKVFALEALGMRAAVDKGLIKSGDSVLIQDAAAIIQRVVTPAATSAKQPVIVLPVAPAVSMQAPRCLVPDYGVRVAAMLAAQ